MAIHNSTICTAGVGGQPCEMCRFAEESARNRPQSPSLTYYRHPRLDTGAAGFLESEAENVSESDSEHVEAIPAPDFTHEWDTAPRARQARVEQEDALWWFMRGVRCGELSQMIEENRLFRSMAEQRGLRAGKE